MKTYDETTAVVPSAVPMAGWYVADTDKCSGIDHLCHRSVALDAADWALVRRLYRRMRRPHRAEAGFSQKAFVRRYVVNFAKAIAR